MCRDSTRVRLTLDASAGEYIHANYINHEALLNKFICTQVSIALKGLESKIKGPLSTTVYDFWRMVFQERVQSIVMLCRWAFIQYEM